MEGFEHVVKVAMEQQGLIVSGPMKFRVKKQTRKACHKEVQGHGYEVDLIGANAEKLVLASVKSFFGSNGVGRQAFRGLADESKSSKLGQHRLFNDCEIQDGIVSEACKRFHYSESQIEMRLYVGKFRKADRKAIVDHLLQPPRGLRPVHVIELDAIVKSILEYAESRT